MTQATCRGMSALRGGARSAAGSAVLWGLLALACSSGSGQVEPPHDGTGGGAGSDATGGAGGEATGGSAGSLLECVPGALAQTARVIIPSPLVSVDRSIAASAGTDDADKLVDGSYHVGNPVTFDLEEESPAWAAIEIGAGPTRLLLMWDDGGWTDYDDASSDAPAAYRIETSADSTDGSDGEWTEVVSVTDNTVRSRAHSFDFAGQTWVRLVLTEPVDGDSRIAIDEIAVHDLSDSGSDRPQDSWLIVGDSITKMAMDRELNDADEFEGQVRALHPSFDPIMLSAGIGGLTAGDGANHVEEWLELNPDFTYVGIAYGTNDSWGNRSNSSLEQFRQNLVAIIEAVLADDRIPILARIPFAATAVHTALPEFIAIIDELQAEYELPCGPDFYSYFIEHQDELRDDGVHPTQEAERSINRLWAEAAAALYE